MPESYSTAQVAHILRIREMYSWLIANPDAKDREFVEVIMSRHQVSRSVAYADLAIVKALLPSLASASRDFHRWRFNEMILETYQMAKKRKDTKTMEKAAASYAKYNRVDLEDEQTLPYEEIVPQPFTPTDDPTVLGIKPIPNLHKRIRALLDFYVKETLDIEDVTFEEADLMEKEYFVDVSENSNGGKEDLLQ